MYLTRDEERIYDGEYGWATQICMRILVRLGELFDGTKLIPIQSAHVSGVSYKTLGDAPIEFLQALANAQAKVKVNTTLNPQSFDPEYLSRKLPENLCRKQLKILKHFEKMGFSKSLTCTPYHLRKPRQNSHLAWAESSAVVYANSVLGAWTNREGGPSALASAIIGKTPDYGMHKAKNRLPNVVVDVRTPLQNEAEFGALGILLGNKLKHEIPLIQGLECLSDLKLKQLGAALATTGMINIFYYTSQSRTGKTEKISVENEELKRTVESLSSAPDAKPDLVFIGCPHCSLKEIRRIAKFMNGKKVKSETEFWVCTSRYTKQRAKAEAERIRNSGGHVLTGVCAVVSWPELLGIKTIMTNSAKTAYYAPTLNKAETILAPLQQCVKTVLE